MSEIPEVVEEKEGVVLNVGLNDIIECEVFLCGDCHYFAKKGGLLSIDVGDCRIRAPIITAAGSSAWPQVLSGEWCGESRPSLEKIVKIKNLGKGEATGSPQSDCSGRCRGKAGTDKVDKDEALIAPDSPG